MDRGDLLPDLHSLGVCSGKVDEAADRLLRYHGQRSKGVFDPLGED